MMLLDPYHLAAVINATLKYYTDFCKNWRLPQKRDVLMMKLLSNTIALFTFMNFFCPVWVLLHYLIFPTNAAYPCSFMWLFCRWELYLLSGGSYFWLLISIFSNITTVSIFTLVIYIFVICTILSKEFFAPSVRKTRNYTTSNSLRSPGNLQLAYRTFELLVKNANDVIAPVLVPAQAVITQFSLSCNYLLILDHASLDLTSASLLLLWSGGALALWTVVLAFGGYIHTQGSADALLLEAVRLAEDKES
ncbi:hypothetical protein Fcan01_20189 [Folsomia candida]|uniref:Uncharacterized protein n=1 Tax=Folsomia candida TaxID=158441 RepID=A0A226DJK5_FOLCA|nr:hypothetical protein Fcan01_20189 [Folsomia candida]